MRHAVLVLATLVVAFIGAVIVRWLLGLAGPRRY